MSETKINASQTTITANDIGAAPVYDTMPTAAVGYLDKIVQFVGTTDASYTNGYFYKCVSDGASTPTYSWTAVQVQAGGGSSLPSQTGNSGKFLTTDGTDASWSDKPLVNGATDATGLIIGNGTADNDNSAVIIGYDAGSNKTGANNVCIGRSAKIPTNANVSRTNGVMIGYAATVDGNYSIALGPNAAAGNTYDQGAIAIGYSANSLYRASIAIGKSAKTGARYTIQLNASDVEKTNSDANTFKVANENGNFEMMSADGTIPTDRFTTTPSADGTYVPTLTISSGVATRSWSAPGGGGSTAATGTLVAADWSSSSQTINVTGVTASNNVIVAPAPANQADYTAAGIICTAQGAGTLTFTCTSTPSSDLTVNVLII